MKRRVEFERMSRQRLLQPDETYEIEHWKPIKKLKKPKITDIITKSIEKFIDNIELKAAVIFLSIFIAFVLIVYIILKNERAANAIYRIDKPAHFETTEFDVYVHESRLKFSKAASILRSSKASRFFDYKIIRPDILTKIENVLSKDISVDPEETVDSSKHLLGTHLIWTGAYIDSTDLKMHYLHDSANRRFANFPHKDHNGQCFSNEYFENYINSHKTTRTFRIVIEVRCRGTKNGDILTRKCKDSCLTLIADDSDTEALLAYYSIKDVPSVNLKNNIVKVRSVDNKHDFVFHKHKVSKEGLERLMRQIGAEKLSISVLESGNLKTISNAFKEIKVKGHELFFWTDGFVSFTSQQPREIIWGNSTTKMEDIRNWCTFAYIGRNPKVHK